MLGDSADPGNDSSGSGRYSNLVPFRNEAADEIVDSLGIEELQLRDPEKLEDHGTTYLFVDPAFSPEDLAWAIGRNWWPLLERHEADIEIFDYQGELVEIETREREELRPFIECFDVAIGKGSDSAETKDRAFIDSNGVEAGVLVVEVDVGDDGWSYDDPDENANLVALVRNDMVIAYQRSPAKRKTKPPFVRGTFVVSREGEASRMLKMTEGHLHNSWKVDPAEVGSEENAAFAAGVLKKIHAGVKALRERFEEREDPKETKIRVFQELFSGKSKVKGPTATGEKSNSSREFVRDYGRVDRQFDDADPTSLRMSASAEISLRADHPKDEVWYRIEPGWAVREEPGKKFDRALLAEDSVVVPEGFRMVGRFLEGKLTKEPVQVTWGSGAFPDLWLVEPELRLSPLGGGSN